MGEPHTHTPINSIIQINCPVPIRTNLHFTTFTILLISKHICIWDCLRVVVATVAYAYFYISAQKMNSSSEEVAICFTKNATPPPHSCSQKKTLKAPFSLSHFPLFHISSSTPFLPPNGNSDIVLSPLATMQRQQGRTHTV